jgi:hypothetical protein
MPSIEIAAIGMTVPLAPPPTSFAVVYEAGLKSHRSQPSRFQEDFDGLSGCLYHLGHPSLKGVEDRVFFGYELLSERSRETDPPSIFEFAVDHTDSAKELLMWLLKSSPQGKLLFTSDWQFGPEETRRFEATSIEEFWRLHDSARLVLNSAYPIARDA